MRRHRHQHAAPSSAAAASLLLATPFANFLTSPRQNVSHVLIEAKLGAPAMTTMTTTTTMTTMTTGGENLGKRSHRRLQPGKVETKNTYTEVQCLYWQRTAWNRDEDSSGGLDREEFFGFLNVISLDHFSEDSGGGIGARSWQDIFNKMATVSRIGEDTLLQVSTDGFSTATATGQPQQDEEEAIDPKIEKEQQKYRDEFCKSIFEEMLRGGVDVATMDLAIFTDGIFESDESSSWESNATSTTTASDGSATGNGTESSYVTSFFTNVTSSDESESFTNATKSSENPTTVISSSTTAAMNISLATTTTAPPFATTTSIDRIATSPIATTTTTWEPRTTAVTLPATTITSTTINYSKTYSTDFRIEGMTTSTPLPDVNPTTSETPSTTVTLTTISEIDSKLDNDNGDLSIGKHTNPIAALEQVMLQSNGGDGADGDEDDGGAMDTRGSNTLSTGAIVGVFFGLATMVVSIVTVVTRHPYFDPCERDEF